MNAKSNEEIQDRIDNYLLGRMPNEERSLFEIEISNTDDIRSQYNFTRLLKEKISQQAILESEVAQWNEEIAKKQTKKGKSKSKQLKIIFFVSGIAASIVILLMFNYYGIKVSKVKQTAKIEKGTNAGEIKSSIDSGLKEKNMSGSYNNFKVIQHNTEFVKEANSPQPLLSHNVIKSGEKDLVAIQDQIIKGKYEDALFSIHEKEKYLNMGISSASHFGINGDTITERKEDYESLNQEKSDMIEEDLALLKVYTLMGLGRKQEAQRKLDEIRKKKSNIHRKEAETLYNKWFK